MRNVGWIEQCAEEQYMRKVGWIEQCTEEQFKRKVFFVDRGMYGRAVLYAESGVSIAM
jgi:hypothetical protein